MTKLSDLPEGVEYAIVPWSFIIKWKKFLRNPTRLPRPLGLGTERFICSHNLLRVDPHDLADLDQCFVLRREYNLLADL